MKQTLLRIAAPSVVDMLQADHEHVMTIYHDYRPDAPSRQRASVAACACVALQVHSLLEEEIFYPALRMVTTSPDVLDRGEAEPRAVRSMIEELRTIDAASPRHDAVFLRLMRDTLHHGADEETVLMPQARVLLRDQRTLTSAPSWP